MCLLKDYRTADVLLFFDKLFDSFNGSFIKAKKKTGKALLGPVTPSSLHKSVWANAKLVLKSMKFIKGKTETVVPSIKNWLMTIENIELMTQMRKVQVDVFLYEALQSGSPGKLLWLHSKPWHSEYITSPSRVSKQPMLHYLLII